MSVVSYAQNQEDVVLHRVLRDVEHGFYIDVGAQQPVVDSVTKLFYEHGWRGINIDPLPQWHGMLEADRPHDVNLQVAVGAVAGRMSLYAIPDTGLSTADAELAKRHAKAGYIAEEIVVDVRTLDDICQQYSPAEVHFLKIDVEGAEEQVLRGFSFDRVRPWVVVVEAVEPVAQREDDDAAEAVTTHASWEPLLLQRGYEFVYWDGLNRFYLAAEHKELRARFGAPPNPLDAFVRYNDLAKHERILQLEAERRSLVDAAELAALQERLGDYQALAESAQKRLYRIGELEQENARLHGRIAALEEPGSPIRNIIDLLREDVERARSQSVERKLLVVDRDRLLAEAMQLRQELEDSAQKLDQRSSELSLRTREVEGLRMALEQVNAKLHLIISSRSWRLTKPFRAVARVFRGDVRLPAIRDAKGRHVFRLALRHMLLSSVRFVQRHEFARNMANRLLVRMPMLRNHLSAFARHHAAFTHSQTYAAPATTSVRDSRSPDVATIYARMHSVISYNKKPR